jgi:hypothetical protein
MTTTVDSESVETGREALDPVTALHVREVQVHERAAEFHKRAADYFERSAAYDHAHGWEQLAKDVERRADEQREAAAAEHAKADLTRDALEAATAL